MFLHWKYGNIRFSLLSGQLYILLTEQFTGRYLSYFMGGNNNCCNRSSNSLCTRMGNFWKVHWKYPENFTGIAKL